MCTLSQKQTVRLVSKSRQFYSQEAQRMKEKYFVNDGFIIIGVLTPVSNQRDN